MNEYNITKKMISLIKESKLNKPNVEGLDENICSNKPKTMLQEHKEIVSRINEDLKKKVITEENEPNSNDNETKFNITKNTPQYGDVRVSQEESLRKTLGEDIEMKEDGLCYYPNNKDLVLTAKIDSLNIVFQFKYRDQSGDGCYIWANGLQLTETNERTIGKIRDSFKNWKDNLIQNSDLLEKLHKSATE
jgi:oligoribonuclease NrnB/cAMP/cGMP phosphodiesterase (DHH superfamily)